MLKKSISFIPSLILFLLIGLPIGLYAQMPQKSKGQDWPHPGGSILAISFSADGKTALSVNSEGLVKFWEIESGKMVWSINFDLKASAAAFFQDKKVALAKDWDQESTILLFDIKRNKEIETVSGHRGSIKTLTFSSNGESVLSGGWDKEVMLWGTTYGDLSRIFKGHTHLRGWNPIGLFGDLFGDLFRVLGGGKYRVNSAVLSSDDTHVAAGGSDGKVTIWMVSDQKIVKTMSIHGKEVSAIAFSPDGQSILTSGIDAMKKRAPISSVQLWDVLTGKQIVVLAKKYAGEVTTVAFSPDGKSALFADRKGIMKLWDIETNKAIRTFEGDSEIRKELFSSDGKLVLTGGDGKIKLWDTTTGTEVGPSPFSGKSQGAGQSSPVKQKPPQRRGKGKP